MKKIKITERQLASLSERLLKEANIPTSTNMPKPSSSSSSMSKMTPSTSMPKSTTTTSTNMPKASTTSIPKTTTPAPKPSASTPTTPSSVKMEEVEDNQLLIDEEAYSDLFKFLEQDPKNMTQGSAYYVNSMNSYMNKFILDDKGEKVPNPMYDKLYKNTRFLFKWNDTYGKAVDRKAPEHQMGQRSGTFEKVQGFDVLEQGNSGLYLPIIPTGSESTYSILDGGELKPISKEEIQKYIRPSKPSTSATGSGVDFRPLILDKVYKLTGGGNVWINPKFSMKYMGPGA